MKKVLIITYYWPPAGGPGVQRILKFVKYLSGLGWTSVILTVDKGNYPALDYSLVDEIPEGCCVYKTKNREPDILYKKFVGGDTQKPIPVGVLAARNKVGIKQRLAHWIRMNIFLPDAKIFWKSNAMREGKKIIRSEHPDIILSSSPPPTVHLIAKNLAKWANLKWIADFRDPWSQIHYYAEGRSKLSSVMDRKIERKTLQQADQIICVSKQFAELLETENDENIAIIPNGFDRSDFVYTYERSDKFRITYIGGINENRFYPSFFRNVRNLIETDHELAERMEILIGGSVAPVIEHELREMYKGRENLKFMGYLDHKVAIELMTQSDILMLFLEKVQKYEGHIPGKLFEYLATGNYILGIGPAGGESAEFIKKFNAGTFISAESDISDIINEQFRNWKQGSRPQANLEEINKYNRENLSIRLVEQLEKLIA